MTLVYNIEPWHVDIVFKVGDTINLTFSIALNDVPFDMSGMDLKMQFKRKDGLLVKTLDSAGGTITILVDTYHAEDAGFLVADVLDYDLQVDDGTNIMTVQEGEAFVKKQITS